MSCPCEPCEQQPFRCSCERDCWTGAPEDYETCMADCETAGCTFPEYPGLPSRGYTCPDEVAGYSDCTDACATALTDAVDDCAATRGSCETEACYSAECSCTNTAQQDYYTCLNTCDSTILYPAALACAQADVTADQTCCDTDLGDCYEPCETTFLTDAGPIEAAYLTCKGTIYGSYFGYYFWDTSGDTPFCNSAPLPDFSACERAWVLSMAELKHDRRICRATCERDEIRREEPADRKVAECGGRELLCDETCAADFELAVAEIVAAAYVCLGPCFAIIDDEVAAFACAAPCYTTYRDDFAQAHLDQGQCALDCCLQEYDHVRHGHVLSTCRWDCHADGVRASVDCYDTYTQCVVAAGGDTTAMQLCMDDWCTCDDDWRLPHDNCMRNCRSDNVGDCPDCYAHALAAIDRDGSNSFGYSGTYPGIPDAGVLQFPVDCTE